MKLLIVLALFSTIASASGGKSDQAVSVVDLPTNEVASPTGLWPFLGLGAGLNIHDVNGHQDGAPTQLKLLGSYYLAETPWIFEGGIGFQNYRFLSASRPKDDTWNGLLEASARYKFADHWQAGPHMFMALGNGDDLMSSSNTFTSYVGGQVLREWNGENNIYRIGGRALVDTSIPERTSTIGLIEFHISFGNQRVAAVAVERPQPVVAVPVIEPNKIILPPVNFDTGMVSPYEQVSDKVREFADVLSKNSHLFGSLTISGHADFRGPESVNDVLSFSRAQNIRKVFSQAGLNDSKIKVVGFGEHKPLSSGRTTVDLMKNRRIEIEFHNVKDQEALDKILKIVR
jgi:outer membrane protein OmpA-like peptidoglycan-associated protein